MVSVITKHATSLKHWKKQKAECKLTIVQAIETELGYATPRQPKKSPATLAKSVGEWRKTNRNHFGGSRRQTWRDHVATVKRLGRFSYIKENNAANRAMFFILTAHDRHVATRAILLKDSAFMAIHNSKCIYANCIWAERHKS